MFVFTAFWYPHPNLRQTPHTHTGAVRTQSGTSSGHMYLVVSIIHIVSIAEPHFWREILKNFSEATKHRFHALSILIELYLIAPVSTAVCECGFSCLKHIKGLWRCSLTTMCLHRLMFLSIQGPHPDNFDALGAVHRWWGSSVKARTMEFTGQQG